MSNIAFSIKDRKNTVQAVKDDFFDVLIVGGGITGAGILLDAQTRGMNATLVEMQDFAAGTSSRSTKLIHGGLRYLKQGEFKLVAQVGKERKIVYKNAPHLTRPIDLLLPITKNGSISRLTGKIALLLYDWLAKVLPQYKHKMLSKKATLERLPGLNEAILKGGIAYTEFTTDDARLTLENIKEAVKRGAKALNYTKVIGFLYEDKKVQGVKVQDTLTDETYSIYAKNVINASGPWTDNICRLDDQQVKKKLFLTKGVHVVLDKNKFPLAEAIYFDVGDKRMIFAIPKFGKVYVGTTDTAYNGSIDQPDITEADRSYILGAINNLFPELNLQLEDIESAWSGLRPLILEEGKSPSEISRKDEVFVTETGLITIAGGKLTGYRIMAEKIVDMLTKQPCITDRIPLSGGNFNDKPYRTVLEKFKKMGEEKGVAYHDLKWLFHRYGTNTKLVLENLNKSITSLPVHIFAALKYGIDYEMVATPCDFFIRRTGMLYFEINSVIEYKTEVIKYMAEYFDWSQNQVVEFKKALDDEITAVR